MSSFCAPFSSGQQLPLGRSIPDPSAQEIDDMINRDMTRLSIEERENALNDIHGIVSAREMAPEFVASRLDDLEWELDHHKTGTAYEAAAEMSEEYISNRAFRLQFLRAHNFDARTAARRIIEYFEGKRSLFGKEKLTKDITLEDLDEDDLATLKSGYLQLLPMKDRSGRRILGVMTKLRTFKHVENVVRVSSDQ
jgi:hypothetical protein